MAACCALSRDANAIRRSCHQCKAGKRRSRDRCSLYHARKRTLSVALEVISGGHEFDQQEERAGASVRLGKPIVKMRSRSKKRSPRARWSFGPRIEGTLSYRNPMARKTPARTCHTQTQD